VSVVIRYLRAYVHVVLFIVSKRNPLNMKYSMVFSMGLIHGKDQGRSIGIFTSTGMGLIMVNDMKATVVATFSGQPSPQGRGGLLSSSRGGRRCPSPPTSFHATMVANLLLDVKLVS
jgi:hypothetical protein